MKRKRLGILMAVIFAVSGPATAVYAADSEELDIFAAENEFDEQGQSGQIVEEIKETDMDLFSSEMTEEEDFSSGEGDRSEEFTDSEVPVLAAQGEYRAHYEGGYLTKEQFEQWKQTGEEPDNWVQVGFYDTLVSLEELFAKMKEENLQNTGYLMISMAEEAEGFCDLKAPEGVALALAGGVGHSIQSISAPGSVVCVRNDVRTPGTLRLEKGTTLEICDGHVDGVIEGADRDTTVLKSSGWTRIGGITNVGTVKFSERSNSLEITGGPTEFFHIENSFSSEDKNVYLNFLGYEKGRVPVFHNTFDFGIQSGVDEEGNHDSHPAGIGIHFVKNMDVEEWEFLDIGTGNPAVRFDLANDGEVLETSDKMWVGGMEPGYNIDMDGTAVRDGIGVDCYVSTGQMSAEQLFEKDGFSEMPENCTVYLGHSGTLENVWRRINGAQINGIGEGYYAVNLPRNYQAKESLTVPDSAKGVKYWSRMEHDENGNLLGAYPAKISAVHVPAGKKLGIMNLMGGSGTMKVTGEGVVIFGNCHMSQKVVADGTVEIGNVAMKSLICDTLIARDAWSRFVVGEYLKFNKASMHATCIYALPGAYLNFGTLDNQGMELEGDIEIFLGTSGSKKANIGFAGRLFTGKESYTDSDGQQQESSRPILLYRCDTDRAKKAGASFTENCYSANYEFDWKGEEHYFGRYISAYTRKEECLATISEQTKEDFLSNLLVFIFEEGEKVEQSVWLNVRYDVADLFSPADDGIDGNKYRTAYYNREKDQWEKCDKYFQVGGTAKESLGTATVSSIKNQTYNGKAKTPTVTVKINGKTLKNKTDYTVSYKNNVKVGTATVTITGKGNYVGTLTKTFKIVYAVPAKDKIYTSGSLKYKVTKSSATSGTVAVYAPVKKTCTSISIPATVKLRGYTFKVTAVGTNAFKSCTKLKKATIGANVTTIGKQAFYGCKALKSINISSKVLKTVGSSSLKGIYAKAVIKVPSSKLSTYKKLLSGKGQSKTVKITK